jgi:histidine phosphotransferase ChpT
MADEVAGLDLKVLELLSSRLCHDLISPVGAINNGVELLEEVDGDVATEAMALIAESGRRAAGRLRCYRLAYGAAGGQAGVGLDEARQVAEAYLAGGKVSLDWPPAEPGPARRAGTVKMALNLIVLGEEALAYGGMLRVGVHDQGLTVAAEGRSARLSEEQAGALEGSLTGEALTPRSVHAHITGLFARPYGFDVEVGQVKDGRLELRLKHR